MSAPGRPKRELVPLGGGGAQRQGGADGCYSSSGALSGKMMSVYPNLERSRIRIG
jgi:hypothetical protein